MRTSVVARFSRLIMKELGNPHWSGSQKFFRSVGAHKYGIAKVFPPPEYVPKKGGYDDVNVSIPTPIYQILTGKQGLSQKTNNVQKNRICVKDFEKLVSGKEFNTPPHFDCLNMKIWSGSIARRFCMAHQFMELTWMLRWRIQDWNIKKTWARFWMWLNRKGNSSLHFPARLSPWIQSWIHLCRVQRFCHAALDWVWETSPKLHWSNRYICIRIHVYTYSSLFEINK